MANTTDGSALTVGVHDLLTHRGTRRTVEASVDIGGLATSAAFVAEDTTVHASVLLDSINEGIVLSATLEVPWEGECRRCLEPAHGVTTVEVHEIYRLEPLEDELPIVDESIDVGAAIRDAAMLSLPVAPLCGEDCLGPAPQEFPVKTETEPEAKPLDPRWAALDQLNFDSEPPSE